MTSKTRYASALRAAAFVVALLLTGSPAVAQTPDTAFQAFGGVRLGMTREEVRNLLGKPSEKDDAQDFYVRSDTRRIRVYFGEGGAATALVASFIGADAGAPNPEAILGVPAQAAPDGSASGTASRPEKGYRVSYSRTVGDTPMVFVTVQKL